ncbi:unnamed protein product [Cochlearia groenlandica]
MVEIPARFKRTDAVFDVVAARARPQCVSCSGSDHSPEDIVDLWDLVESFIEKDSEILHVEENNNDKSDVVDEEEEEDDYEDVKERLRRILENNGGGLRRRIMDAVVETENEFVGDKRHLMTCLRIKGFDAGLCKSRWERFGKNTAGKYEYVDVYNGDDAKNRFIIETNLVGEFEIARPTTKYISLLAQLPRVFIGTPEELRRLVRIMCFEMRRSMKRAEIYVPPWRRNGYMQAKWFGHYKRTTNNQVVTRVKSCECGPRFGFVESVKTTAFTGFTEEMVRNGLKIGRLTVAFNGGEWGSDSRKLKY